MDLPFRFGDASKNGGGPLFGPVRQAAGLNQFSDIAEVPFMRVVMVFMLGVVMCVFMSVRMSIGPVGMLMLMGVLMGMRVLMSVGVFVGMTMFVGVMVMLTMTMLMMFVVVLVVAVFQVNVKLHSFNLPAPITLGV